VSGLLCFVLLCVAAARASLVFLAVLGAIRARTDARDGSRDLLGRACHGSNCRNWRIVR